MRKFIATLLRESLQPSKYKEWASNNRNITTKSWATQYGMYKKYFRPIDNKNDLEALRATLLPKLDDSTKMAFITFYNYKKDVLDGVLDESYEVSLNEKLSQDYLYHATYKELLPLIKKEGLGGSSSKPNWEDSKSGVIYFARTPEIAESYAETAENVPEEWLDDIIILRVDKNVLDSDKLFYDKNVLTYDDEEKDTFEYHGIVNFSDIDIIADGGLNEVIALDNPEEYVGHHGAPTKKDSPMYDVTNVFPDIYGENGYKYYGTGEFDDYAVINQIKAVHNKPKAWVVIYRAVPYINKEIDKKIKGLNDLLKYKYKFGFFPVGNEFIYKLEDKVWGANPSFTYDEMVNGVVDALNKMVDELIAQKGKPIKINNGDWVTTSLSYAKDHGINNLNNNFKIVKKTVRASELYSDGNSVFEWGYNR